MTAPQRPSNPLPGASGGEPVEVVTIHEAVPDTRQAATRRKLKFFDRVKVFVLLFVILA